MEILRLENGKYRVYQYGSYADKRTDFGLISLNDLNYEKKFNFPVYTLGKIRREDIKNNGIEAKRNLKERISSELEKEAIRYINIVNIGNLGEMKEIRKNRYITYEILLNDENFYKRQKSKIQGRNQVENDHAKTLARVYNDDKIFPYTNGKIKEVVWGKLEKEEALAKRDKENLNYLSSFFITLDCNNSPRNIKLGLHQIADNIIYYFAESDVDCFCMDRIKHHELTSRLLGINPKQNL